MGSRSCIILRKYTEANMKTPFSGFLNKFSKNFPDIL